MSRGHERGIWQTLGNKAGEQIPVLRFGRPVVAEPASLGLSSIPGRACPPAQVATARGAVQRQQAHPSRRRRACVSRSDERRQRRTQAVLEIVKFGFANEPLPIEVSVVPGQAAPR